MARCENCLDFEDPLCTNHPGKNYCGPCGAWIEGTPCDMWDWNDDKEDLGNSY